MDTNHPPGEDDLNINPFQKTPGGSDTVTVKLNEFKKVLVILCLQWDTLQKLTQPHSFW